jgi:hypothetical protein
MGPHDQRTAAAGARISHPNREVLVAFRVVQREVFHRGDIEAPRLPESLHPGRLASADCTVVVPAEESNTFEPVLGALQPATVTTSTSSRVNGQRLIVPGGQQERGFWRREAMMVRPG